MTFVLVHGGWHGAWCWRDVVPLLRAAGHEVRTPTLTGLGERADELTREVGLATHVDDVVAALDGLHDVTLVGHSYAGMAVTGAADRVPERLAHVVHLDAFVPGDGDSLLSLLPEPRRAMYVDSARDGWLVPPPPAAGLGLCGEDAQRLTPQPLATFTQPLHRPRPHAVPSTYVHCTEGPAAASFAGFAARAERLHMLPTLHDAMLTMPGRVAGILKGT